MTDQPLTESLYNQGFQTWTVCGTCGGHINNVPPDENYCSPHDISDCVKHQAEQIEQLQEAIEQLTEWGRDD